MTKVENAEKVLSIVQSLSPARARSGHAGHNRREGPPEHHDHAMAYHARVRTAAGGMRVQQPQLPIRSTDCELESVMPILNA
jgi:hypothetical protein